MCNSPGDRLTLDVLKLEMKNVASLEQKLLKNEGFGAVSYTLPQLSTHVFYDNLYCCLLTARSVFKQLREASRRSSL